MKDTVRTASVLEIYNTSISELNSKLSEAKSELMKEKTAKVGFYFLSLCIYAICIILMIFCVFGLILAIFSSERNPPPPLVYIVCAIFGLGGFFGFKGWKKHVYHKTNNFCSRIRDIERNIDSTEAELREKNARKKSLLEVEQVVVAKDFKDIGSDKQEVPYTKTDVNEKNCPMCAETVKAAAKICRYCNYRFE